LGVAEPEWKDDSVVIIKGWRYIGPVSGASWTYRLTRENNVWTVMTAKGDQIA